MKIRPFLTGKSRTTPVRPSCLRLHWRCCGKLGGWGRGRWRRRRRKSNKSWRSLMAKLRCEDEQNDDDEEDDDNVYEVIKEKFAVHRTVSSQFIIAFIVAATRQRERWCWSEEWSFNWRRKCRFWARAAGANHCHWTGRLPIWCIQSVRRWQVVTRNSAWEACVSLNHFRLLELHRRSRIQRAVSKVDCNIWKNINNKTKESRQVREMILINSL